MYENIPMNQRIDRIGKLLAKAVYLYTKKQKKQKEKEEEQKND